jgi:hypothetical protein
VFAGAPEHSAVPPLPDVVAELVLRANSRFRSERQAMTELKHSLAEEA